MNGCKYCKKPCTECEFDSCIKEMGESRYYKLKRNALIKEAFYQGETQKEIAVIFNLSIKQIKRVLAGNRGHLHS